MMDGITHAIATCDRIERGLTDAAGHAKHALAEMQIELQNMLDAINADRAAPAWPLWTSRCRGFPNKRATIQTSVVDHAIYCRTSGCVCVQRERTFFRQYTSRSCPIAAVTVIRSSFCRCGDEHRTPGRPGRRRRDMPGARTDRMSRDLLLSRTANSNNAGNSTVALCASQ